MKETGPLDAYGQFKGPTAAQWLVNIEEEAFNIFFNMVKSVIAVVLPKRLKRRID